MAEKRLTIGEVHGQLLTAQGRPLFPLYHPASVIYNPSLREIYAADVAALARCSPMEKYNIDFTPFVMQTGFHCAGNVYDSTCVFLLVIRRAAGVAKAAVAA